MQSKKSDKNGQQKTTKKTNYLIWVAVIGSAAVIFGGWNYYSSYQQKTLLAASQDSGIYRGTSNMHLVRLNQASYRFREKKPVVDPMSYSQSRQIKAYTIAKQIPQVLDQLYCYCGCAQSIKHKSLLSCYTDNHAANCGICMDEAELAAKMVERGDSMTRIADAIDSRFN
ncbi:MAG: hypothetical protein HQ517_02850 [SAR324 cluster bacterium]|nr:hypothetical protein [SAR324 cluster bacterium]